MKFFEIPEIDIQKFDVEDVLTTSPDGLKPGDNGMPPIPVS